MSKEWNARKRDAVCEIARFNEEAFRYLRERCEEVSFGACAPEDGRPCLFTCRLPAVPSPEDALFPEARAGFKAILIGGDRACREEIEAGVRKRLSPVFPIVLRFWGERAAQNSAGGYESRLTGGADILYSLKAARHISHVSGHEVYERLQGWMSAVRADHPALPSVLDMYERIESEGIIRNDDREQSFILDRFSGKRYEASYYALDSGTRERCNVNRLLFLYGPRKEYVIREHTEKERKDKIRDDDCLYSSVLFRIRNET